MSQALWPMPQAISNQGHYHGLKQAHPMTKSRRIWIGIGAATLTQVAAERLCALPAAKLAPPIPAHALLHTIGKEHQPGQAGSTGGETYLRDGGPSDTRTRFTRDLILLHGHALIADELVAIGDWSGALAHVTTSTEELRAYLETYMRGQGVAPFSGAVENLTAAIARQDAKAYAAARNAYETHADLAARAMRKFQTPYHRFAVRAAVEALKAASSAYAASLSDGKIADRAEYQDARGFGLVACAAIKGLNTDLSKIDADHTRQIQAACTGLNAAWPTTAVPAGVGLSPEDVAGLIAKIEDLALVFR
jgi:hypothetical protein